VSYRITISIAAAALCAACGSDKATAPVAEKLCGAGGVVTLAINQAATIDCSAGTAVDLAGGGAHYLIVPQFAASHVSDVGVSYTIGAQNGSATADITPVSLSRAEGVPNAGDGEALARSIAPIARAGEQRPGLRQAAFDFALRRRARAAVAGGAWRSSAGLVTRPMAAVPALGSTRTFEVVSSFDTKNPTYAAVNAQLAYVGTNVLVYVDAQSPTGGFTPDQLIAFSKLFDETLYPLDIAAFGNPSDIDGNGHVIMLLTPIVNALVTKADCKTGGYVGGFFDGFDLVSNSVNSNHGEVFYGVVPDPDSTVSCAHPVSELLDVVPATFLHELQHLISFSQHVVVNGGDAEEGWLDEGMSLVAEELGAIHYEQKYPPPSGRSDPRQLFPDSAEGYIIGQLQDSYTYLLRTDTASTTLHSDADGGLAWRGGDWLLMRWLGDQKGTAIYQQLEHNHTTGIANIAAAAGESFPGLFGDFSLALWTDSIVGQPRSSAPQRNRFLTRNLRELYQAYYNAASSNGTPDPDVPRPYPVQPVTLTLGNAASGKMVPGTMMFYRVDASAPIRVKFAPPTGSFNASLHPQLSIYRLPQ
jgi:hypothetical protein